MKRLNEPVVTIPALCLFIFLFVADNQVSGQGTLQREPDAQQESTATARSASTSFSK